MKFMAAYVRVIERFNRRVGRAVMYLLFVMMAVLLWSSFTKAAPFMRPSLWTLETAQFLMVAYFMLGGPYSIQLDTNVRMDLIYGAMSLRRKAFVDSFTVLFLIVYLGFLLYGGLNSLAYSLGHFSQDSIDFFTGLTIAFLSGGPEAASDQLGVLERSRSVWRPVLWPVKLVMIVGIVLMLLQAVAEFFKDIERFRTGRPTVGGPVEIETGNTPGEVR